MIRLLAKSRKATQISISITYTHLLGQKNSQREKKNEKAYYSSSNSIN